MNQEFMEALEELEQEKGIDKQTLLDAIKTALISAYKRNFGITQDARVEIDEQTGAIAVYAEKEVVEEVFDPSFEVSLDADGQAGCRAAHPRGRARRDL